MPTPSNTAVNRAGALLRDWVGELHTAGEGEVGGDDLTPDHIAAFETVSAFRASFQRPLSSVTMSIRQFVQRESSEIVVAQRLKRLPQMIVKLSRFPDMNLARMQDVGGCRAILPGGRPEVMGVLRRMQRNSWDIRGFRDYALNPKDTGYRAVHIVVRRRDRLIEVQLRSRGQHAWAEAVEAGTRMFPGLKDGLAPDPVMRYYRLAAEVIALREAREPVDTTLTDEIDRLQPLVFPPRTDL